MHFVAARGGYEVPVLLPFVYTTWNWSGYGNRGLTPLDASALLRRWHEQWGAELFFAMGPYLELVVDRPPLDPRGAAQAAAELHPYCIDTVQDPVETGDTMARSTMWSLCGTETDWSPVGRCAADGRTHLPVSTVWGSRPPGRSCRSRPPGRIHIRARGSRMSGR
ncbi:DUF4253 domain-containing protein [Streptomyces sp. NPDC056943]|uniref:DUF4253 domain-containing protein n=1 Tax=Streptomyces sp. NPDC056943 TaxID=3345971 RepID=UPI00363B1B52